MKVYVETLPKGCLTCPYIVDKGDYDLCAIKDCIINDAFKYVDKRKKSCPLLSLSDYTKQVRKEVMQEIRELTKDYFYEMLDSEKIILERDFIKVLDQIQGENYEKKRNNTTSTTSIL